MLVELVTTGSELLLGEIVNENVRYLSQQLNKMGYSVIYQTTVGDNPNRMETVLRTALNRADIVITTGGLGPTQGDVTKIIGARVMGVSLVFRKDVMEGVTAWIKLRHPERDLTDNQRRQAMIPEGATVLANEAGTAPGTALYKNGKVLIHLPGPPSEMRWVFNNRVKTYLRRIFGSQGYIYSTYVKIYDMGEARIEDMIMDLVERQSNPTIAMYARIGFVEVRVTAKAADEETAKALVRPVEDELRKRLRRAAVTYNDETVAAALGRALLDRKLTMSCAESCTGGLVGSYITDVAGSSAYFLGSAGTYQDGVKTKLLGVSSETLRLHTAVSEETAAEMAEGSRKLYGSDIAVSTTGIAGPDGGTKEKPAGLVYTGVAGPWGTTVYKSVFPGERKEVKERAATKAVYHALQYIMEHS
ncbi:competence/damage-inducible protein A [Colibacter massiliensis]|uniref:competence/damage-inducible protein A n=1 Tax=Colibacter massiliensis TaxID=1852379 RepID=UPI00266D5B94|nr:competence/damage-inducible protein A [Colibacter massiliensis]